jgi:hypothetical protein
VLTFFLFFPDPHLRPNHAAYWLVMQVGMILGLLASYPANRWLIRTGSKRESDRDRLASRRELNRDSASSPASHTSAAR